jgi:flagellar biosynthesis protein
MKKNKLKAALIKYSKEDLVTPVISGYGTGELAKQIIEQAKKNNIKIVENKAFFEFESLFKVGQEIPYEVYKIVARILSCILNTNNMEQINGKKNTN